MDTSWFILSRQFIFFNCLWLDITDFCRTLKRLTLNTGNNEWKKRKTVQLTDTDYAYACVAYKPLIFVHQPFIFVLLLLSRDKTVCGIQSTIFHLFTHATLAKTPPNLFSQTFLIPRRSGTHRGFISFNNKQ